MVYNTETIRCLYQIEINIPLASKADVYIAIHLARSLDQVLVEGSLSQTPRRISFHLCKVEVGSSSTSGTWTGNFSRRRVQ